MTIPAILYDGASAAGTQIATVTLRTERRAVYVPIRTKLDDGWVSRVSGEGGIEMRIIAEGLTSLAWIAALHDRQDQRIAVSYHVALALGDAHTGSFMIEEIAETEDSADRRRFRLVLLSNGRTVYTPAP